MKTTRDFHIGDWSGARALRYRFRGEALTVREISALTGLTKRAIYHRIVGDQVVLTVHRRGCAPKTHSFRGEQLTAREIAGRTGLSESAVRSRLMDGRFVAYGEMEAIPRDPRINARFAFFKGRKQTVSAWAHEYGVSPSMVYARLNRAWSIERALTTPPAENGRHRSALRKAPPSPARPARLPGATSRHFKASRGPATSGTHIIHNQTQTAPQ